MAELYSDTGEVLMSSPGTIDELRDWIEENVDKEFHVSNCYDMDAFGGRNIVAYANLAGLRDAVNDSSVVVDCEGFVSKEKLLESDQRLADMVDALNSLDWGELVDSEAYDEFEAETVESFLERELEEYGDLAEFRGRDVETVRAALWELYGDVWTIQGDWPDYCSDKLVEGMRELLDAETVA